MKAIILCAGKGERLKPLTETVPKPMVLINGKPILEYLILLCRAHGINEITINTSYLPKKIKEYFGNGEKWSVKIKYSFEPELLGTSGALNNFRDFLKDEQFFVIYGDAITEINLSEMLKFHKQKKGIATLALRSKPKESKRDTIILADENLKINKFIEKPPKEDLEKYSQESNLVSSGIYLFESEILNLIPQGFSDFAYDIFPRLIEQGEKIYGFMMDEYYFRELGNIEKYQKAKEEIESGKIKLNFINKTITEKKMNKAVFIDRDGVINESIYEIDGQIMAPATLEQVKILPKVKEGIKKMREMGFKIISITNQPGIALGYLSPEKLKEINNYLKKELEIDEIYYCPHHPSKGRIREFIKECDCRKPSPKLIKQASKDFSIDLSKSYIIGDSLIDIQTGQNAGLKKTFLIGIEREDILAIQHQKKIFPDFTCKNLLEVIEKIKEIEGF